MDIIEEYVKDLASVSEKWYYSFHPEQCSSLKTEEIDAIERLNHLGMGYFRPLVVASIINSNIGDGKRMELFNSIERVILLVFRMSRSMSTYQSSVYYRRSYELAHSKVEIDYVIYLLNKLFIDNLVQGVKTFKVKMNAEFDNGEGFFHWKPLRYILYEYELSLYSEGELFAPTWEEFTRSYKDKVSIEHIYPQTPNEDDWPDFDGCEGKNKLLNSLGNLLLLNKPKNSSLQNISFAEKKEGNPGTDKFTGYKEGSASEREVCKNDKWGPEEIRDRGIKILEFIEKRWRISFRDREQMYDILAIPEKYRVDVEEEEPIEKKAKLDKELLGRFDGYKESDIEKTDVSIDKISVYAQDRNKLFISGITYGDRKYRKKNTRDNVVALLEDIIKEDPSRLDVFCEIRAPYEWYPQFTKSEPKSKQYEDMGGVYVYVPGGRDALRTLNDVIKIYEIDPSTILIRVKKR